MKRPPRNIAASVRSRLKGLARTEKRSVQAILLRYIQEGLLCRLAEPKHADDFVLEGGLLIAEADQGLFARGGRQYDQALQQIAPLSRRQ